MSRITRVTFDDRAFRHATDTAASRFGARAWLWGSLLASVALALSWANDAHAYCTLTDCREDAREGKTCEREDGCIVEGIPLYPKSPCFQFTIAAGQAQAIGLSDEDFESIVQRAFARWKAVDCGNGRRPGFRVVSAGVVELEQAFACDRRRLNADTWLLVSEWQRAPQALGYTVSTHAVLDGEVFDADVEINASKLANEVEPNLLEAALLSVGTHEAGHVLGLHHSNDPTAVMAATYGNPGDIRDLTVDDIAGVCNLFPDDPETIVCAEPAIEDAALSESACERAGGVAGSDTMCSAKSVNAGRAPVSTTIVLLLACVLVPLRVTHGRPTSRRSTSATKGERRIHADNKPEAQKLKPTVRLC